MEYIEMHLETPRFVVPVFMNYDVRLKNACVYIQHIDSNQERNAYYVEYILTNTLLFGQFKTWRQFVVEVCLFTQKHT